MNLNLFHYYSNGLKCFLVKTYSEKKCDIVTTRQEQSASPVFGNLTVYPLLMRHRIFNHTS